VRGFRVAQLSRQRDEYVLEYFPNTAAENFVGLAMPVQPEAWRWPRDLHPFLRQNLPEGSFLEIIREELLRRKGKRAIIGRSDLLGKR
jgi:serine/threonine-protein kinase HipA